MLCTLPSEVAIQVTRHAESEFIYLFTVYKLRGRIRKFIKLSLLPVVAKRIMEKRPGLAREEDKHMATPMHMAVHWDKIDVLRVLLEHDWSLGYVLTSNGNPILASVASRGYVGAARELLKHCPDAPYCDASSSTCLHIAVLCGHTEFVRSILGLQQLGHLINMLNGSGETALHLAVRNCKPDMVAALQLHQDIDVTVLNSAGDPASLVLPDAANHKALISVRFFFSHRKHIF
jgi:ankyrin repeat protein